jgi:alpha,alpha-trehalase
VDWLCFPRFDAPAVFARILDQDAGHFWVRPAGEFQARRAYLDGTMALETTFTTATGTGLLVDAMAVGRNERGHDLGTGSPGVLLRRVTCTEGTVELEVSYAPRPEFGLIHPILEAVPGGLAARGGADRLLLSAPIGFSVVTRLLTPGDGLVSGSKKFQPFSLRCCLLVGVCSARSRQLIGPAGVR